MKSVQLLVAMTCVLFMAGNVSAQSITVTSTYDPNPTIPPPAGEVSHKIEGTYEMAAGTAFDKVVIVWFEEVDGKWMQKGTATNASPEKAGSYKFDVCFVKGKKYKVEAKLYKVGDTEPVKQAVTTFTAGP